MARAGILFVPDADDERLLAGCLAHEPRAWNGFVDRFTPVIARTAQHVARLRSVNLETSDLEDLVADVMSVLVENDFLVLRRFRGRSSLATYLTVIARRVAVHRLLRKQAIERRREGRLTDSAVEDASAKSGRDVSEDLHLENAEEIDKLLALLDGREAELVRGYYLEHKSYRDLSLDMGIPENSVGPTLSRLLARLRREASNS